MTAAELRGMRQTTFADDSPEYAAFVEKFRPKKTTDDCYTPPAVYEAVLAWVRRRYGIAEDAPIVRPFWPGGDYERHEYPAGCVVVDNPPFSLTAKIVRFFAARCSCLNAWRRSGRRRTSGNCRRGSGRFRG